MWVPVRKWDQPLHRRSGKKCWIIPLEEAFRSRIPFQKIKDFTSTLQIVKDLQVFNVVNHPSNNWKKSPSADDPTRSCLPSRLPLAVYCISFIYNLSPSISKHSALRSNEKHRSLKYGCVTDVILASVSSGLHIRKLFIRILTHRQLLQIMTCSIAGVNYWSQRIKC